MWGQYHLPDLMHYLLSRNSALATECRTFQPTYLCFGKRFHLTFYGVMEKESSFNIPIHCSFSRMMIRNTHKILNFRLCDTVVWQEFQLCQGQHLRALIWGGLEALEPQIYDCFYVSTIFSRHIPVNL